MLSEKERKIIQRYCLFPQLAWAYLLMDFLISGVFLLLVMINDLVFDGSFYKPGLYLYLGIVILYMILFMVCILSTRIGMQRKKWQNIVRKADVNLQDKDRSAQFSAALGTKAMGSLLSRSENDKMKAAGNVADIASAVGTAALVADMASEMTKNAKLTAAALGVKIPKAGKYITAIAILPIVIMVAAFMPHYISAKNVKDTKIVAASESVYAVQSALESGCDHVYIDDPNESYSSYGYSVKGYLYDTFDSRDSSISVEVNNDGYITEVAYRIDIDIYGDKDENLAKAKSDILELNQLLNESGVKAISDELMDFCEIPEEFADLFQETSYYEEIYWYSDNRDISVNYYTDNEENYGKYSSSYLYIHIDPE